MTAPKRIWLDWPAAEQGEPVYDKPPERDTQPGQTEYIRHDLHLAAVEASRREAWEAVKPLLAAAEAQIAYMDLCNDKGDLERNLRAEIAALRDKAKEAGE